MQDSSEMAASAKLTNQRNSRQKYQFISFNYKARKEVLFRRELQKERGMGKLWG